MAIPFWSLAALAIAAAPLAAQDPPPNPSRGHLARGTWAIIGAHVIPMTADTVLRDATVLVHDGRIVAVGPRDAVQLPSGAERILARGRYLIPGLADMHTHLYSDGAVPDSAGPAELGVMLANGITSARLMIGTPEHLVLRRQVESGEIAGPQLWVASPHFATQPSENARVVTTPDEVRQAVREVKVAGYDFVKVTFGIVGPLYEALVQEAMAQGIRVVGHVEPEVGVRRAIAAGQQIEHLDAYFEGALADSAPMRESITQFRLYRPQNWASLDYIDDAKLTALAVETARAGIWSVPTLEIFNRAFSIPLSDAELHALPDWQMIPRAIRQPYVNSRNRYWAQSVSREQRAEFAEIRNSIVKRIADAGGAGRIMAGSDSPDLLMAYGWAMHREIAHLVRAGLTPWQALAAATRNPAEFLGAMNEWGTIAPGRRADLVLLGGNPLEDIANVGRIEAVIAGGRVFERAELDEMIRRGRVAIDGAAE
ncbi:MAG TPA: amidohydrolase family protein [Gemmatimonadales bacterium]|nr:amidohydrolase family protein [Gemmatimonadales bacterium]